MPANPQESGLPGVDQPPVKNGFGAVKQSDVKIVTVTPVFTGPLGLVCS